MRSPYTRIATRTFLAISGCLGILGPSPVRAQNTAGAPRYVIIDLGVKAPLTNSAGYGLNATGLAAGDQFDGLGAALGFYTDAKGVLHSLGTLRTDKTGTSEATGINNTGWVVGQASSDSGQFHAFRFNSAAAGSAMIDLTPGLFSSSAMAINQFNEVVGSVSDTGTGLFAFLYSPVPVNPLAYLTDATRKASAFGLADDAKVVGQLATSAANTSYNAFLTDSHGVGVANLGTLGGLNSSATGINVSDQVVGSAELSTKYTHAFRTAAGGYPMDATSDLGVFTGKGYSGKNSYAYGINAAGLTVGAAEVTSSPVLLHAFLYDDINGMQDLNSLIPTGSGWVLTSAQAINDSGEIVGVGTIGGVSHAFELVRNPVAAMVIGPITFYAGGTATGTVVLQQPAPAAGAKVALSSSSALLQVPASVTVPAGTTAASFTVTGQGAGAKRTFVTITGTYKGGTATSGVIVTPAVVSTLTIDQRALNQGDTVQGTIVLNAPAPTGGLTVTLTNPAPTSLTIPATVTVPAGQVSEGFAVTGGKLLAKAQKVTITATPGDSGSPAPTAVVNVLAAPTITGVTLSPATLNGGYASTGTITVSAPAPSAGLTIPVKSNTTEVTIGTCSIAPGAVSGQFTITTGSALAKEVIAQLTATLNGNVVVFLDVKPSVVNAGKNNTLVIDPNYLASGGSATASFTGTSASGEYATVTSSDPSVSVPASIYMSPGTSTASFTVSTVPVTQARSVTITVVYSGGTFTTKLNLLPNMPAALTITPGTLIGSVQNGAGTVTLTAPSTGFYLNLSSSDPAAVVPSSIYIAPGATFGSFPVTTSLPAALAKASITAQFNGARLAQKVSVLPILPSLTLSGLVVTGNVQTCTGTVTLSAPSPGVYVNLACSNADASVPGSVYLAPGTMSSSFAVTTPANSSPTALVISATLGDATASATLTVTPITVAALTLTPEAPYGGVDTVTGTVTLSAPSPGMYVNLNSSDAAYPVPGSVYIAPGSTFGTFTQTEAVVTAPVPVIVTATLGTTALTQKTTVLPCQVQRLTLDHSSIPAGGTATATLLLSYASSGQYIDLYSDDPTVSIPASVYVSPGTTSATFTVTAGPVPGISPVTISAYNGDVETSVQLTIH